MATTICSASQQSGCDPSKPQLLWLWISWHALHQPQMTRKVKNCLTWQEMAHVPSWPLALSSAFCAPPHLWLHHRKNSSRVEEMAEHLLFLQRSRFGSQKSPGGSQPSVTQCQGILMPSSVPCRHCTHVVHIHTRRRNTHTHKHKQI